MVTDFAISPEYTATHPTSASFVNGVFEAILGQAPMLPSLRHSQRLSTTVFSRASFVVQSVLSLPETYSSAVTQYYQAFLGRQPDPAGFQFFVNELASGGVPPAVIASQFLSSLEYLQYQDMLAMA